MSAVGEWDKRGRSRVLENVIVSDWTYVWCGWVLLVLWQELLKKAQDNYFNSYYKNGRYSPHTHVQKKSVKCHVILYLALQYPLFW